MSAELTQDRLKKILDYDPLTGMFTWKVAKGRRVHVGDFAGWKEVQGYWAIEIDNKIYKAHRLAWLYVFGVWPNHELDHRDGVRSNNRIRNLREATDMENAKNKGKAVNNTSGFKGVCWHWRTGKWHAKIGFNKKRFHIGYFLTIEAAAKAYEERSMKLFGEFNREAVCL